LFNNTALFYMEKLDSFKLLDSKVMDRIMKDYWNSNVDASGSFFACSTCYNILTLGKLSHNEDYESTHRFYEPFNLNEVRPHEYIYKVYLLSMQQRYFIEIMIFLVIAVYFQFSIDRFNTGQQELNRQIKDWLNITDNGLNITSANEP
jgi:hypothetical protein